jgi:hypothetical protein
VFAKYIEFFIKIYTIFFENPLGLDKAVDKEAVMFFCIPKPEILHLFMKIEYLKI